MIAASKIGGGRSWESLFSTVPTDDAPSCLAFMKRLAYFTFSQILGCRRVVPHSAVVKRPIQGKDFRMYQLNRKDFVGGRCHEKLMGALDAIEKGYLQELMLVISDNDEDEDDALEVFTMRFVYGDEPYMSLVDDDGAALVSQIRYRGEHKVQEDSYRVLEEVFKLCHVLDRLPKTSFCSFRCSYYDEMVPESYVPPNWYKSDTLYKFNHPDAVENFDVADMHTSKAAAFLAVKSSVIVDEYEVREAMKHGHMEVNRTLISDCDRSLNISQDDANMKMFHYANSPNTGRTMVVPTGSTPSKQEGSPDTEVNNNVENSHTEPTSVEPEEEPVVQRNPKGKGRTRGSKNVAQSSSSEDGPILTTRVRGRRGRSEKDDVCEQVPKKLKQGKTTRVDQNTPPVTQKNSPTRGAGGY